MRWSVKIITMVLVIFFGLAMVVVAQTEHSGSITSNETWTAGGNPHIITALTTVSNNATLTIEPGVEVRFNKDATNPRLIIGTSNQTGGKLIAQGTDSQKITFTSNESVPESGDWNAIFFWPMASPDSIIENAIIEYGGGESGGTGSIKIYGASPTIRNSTIRYSSGPGIEIVTNGSPGILDCMIQENLGPGVKITSSWPVLNNNNFLDNDNYPIYVNNSRHPEPVIYGTNAFHGNTPNQVYFRAGTIASDHTLREIGIPYFIPALTTVSNDATLTIEPGVEVRFNKEATNPRLIIGTSNDTSGKLIAQGTEIKKVTFTSNESNPQPGDWNAVFFWPMASPDSIIENAVIEYGGGKSGGTGSIKIYGSSPTIRNSTIRQSSGAGIEIVADGSPEISCSDIENNNIGILASSSDPNLFLFGNNFVGNLDFGVANGIASSILDASYNWWGDASGPGGAGPGTGDMVSSYINYSSWMKTISSCTSAVCELDFDDDGDVDGTDLKILSEEYSPSTSDLNRYATAGLYANKFADDDDLFKFVQEFGRPRCP